MSELHLRYYFLLKIANLHVTPIGIPMNQAGNTQYDWRSYKDILMDFLIELN
jgi:hypothetical protein